jgi:outer membrane protein TolC
VPPEQEVSLGRSPDLEIDFKLDEPAFTPREMDVEEAKKQALARRLDYLQERLALEIREIAVATSRNVLLPDLSFFASLGLTDNGSRWKNTTHFNQGDWVTGLQVQVPFGLVREREQYTQAKISLRQAKNNLEQTRRRILNEVENTVRDVQTLELRLESAYRRVTYAQLSAAGAEVMYEIGEISVFDSAEAQEKLTSATANYVSLFLSYKDALDTLDFVIGEPVEERYGVSL